MTSEKKDIPDQYQTWGYYQNLNSGEEKDGLGQDWFDAGYLDSFSLNDESSVNALHALLNAFNNSVRESQDRPFRLIIEPAATHVESVEADSNELIVKLEPDQSNRTIDELRVYAGKIKTK